MIAACAIKLAFEVWSPPRQKWMAQAIVRKPDDEVVASLKLKAKL